MNGSEPTQGTGLTCEIRRLGEPDLPELQRFVTQEMHKMGWSDAPGEAYFRWKFLKTTHEMREAYVAYDGATMVGFSGVTPRRMYIEGKEHVIIEIVDSYVQKEYRPLKIYRQILSKIIEATKLHDISFSYGRPNDNAAPTTMKMGWRPLRKLVMYSRPLAASFITEKLAEWQTLSRFIEWPVGMVLRASLLPAELMQFAGRAEEPQQAAHGTGGGVICPQVRGALSLGIPTAQTTTGGHFEGTASSRTDAPSGRRPAGELTGRQ
jgi:GNAT superfamily N-acetyltransferase